MTAPPGTICSPQRNYHACRASVYSHFLNPCFCWLRAGSERAGVTHWYKSSVGLRGVGPIPGVGEGVKLGLAGLAGSLAEKDVVIGVGIEGRLEINEVNAGLGKKSPWCAANSDCRQTTSGSCASFVPKAPAVREQEKTTVVYPAGPAELGGKSMAASLLAFRPETRKRNRSGPKGCWRSWSRKARTSTAASCKFFASPK